MTETCTHATLTRRCVHSNFCAKARAKFVRLNVEIVATLPIQPELWGGAEIASESHGGVGLAGALAMYDLVEATR